MATFQRGKRIVMSDNPSSTRAVTEEAMTEIAQALMEQLHEVIQPHGVLVFASDMASLSWHSGRGVQLAVLSLKLPENLAKSFDVSFMAGRSVDFFRQGGGVQKSWTFNGYGNRRGGFIGRGREDEAFRFDHSGYRQFSFYNVALPDVVEDIRRVAELHLAELL